MKEDFLHYLWKFKKFDFLNAETTDGAALRLISTGEHNQDKPGPDFFNAKLEIGGQLWAGNVEVHINSSDWYAHHHETDPAYDNVILHVVWEHDVGVYRKNNAPIPTLTLKNRVLGHALENYRQLLESKKYRWINCERDFADFSDFDLQNWLERLYIERLEEKSKLIRRLLGQTAHDWEAVLFCMLAKNFGLNVNGEAFLGLALSIPFSVVRKIRNEMQMEAVLFGQAGMLSKKIDEPYFLKLKAEYGYLKHKFNLENQGVLPINFFRLRPQNFPTVRLAQLAFLLVSRRNLFSRLINGESVEKIREVFAVTPSAFWKTHYTFDKESKPSEKTMTKNFIDLIIINTVVPLKFWFLKEKGQLAPGKLFELMRQLPQERNRIVRGFHKLRPHTAKNAMDSQALLQLKKEYCDKNRCLHCNLGLKLLQKESS